jgi:hypothetical protein
LKEKNILIFIDWFLPGYKAGDPISSNANLIAHLNNEIKFYVITRNTDYCETEPYKNITSNTWYAHSIGAKVYYISKTKLSLKTIIDISKNIQFDTIFINGIYSWYFSLFPLLWFKYIKRKELIVSAGGMLSDRTFSSKKLKKKLFYYFARTMGLYNHVVIHATNEDEALQIRNNINFKGEIKIAPNLPPKTKTALQTKTKTNGELKLISIARISPEKNTLFALNILLAYSEMSKSDPIHFVFDLYGTIYNESYWEECKSVIAARPSYIIINFKGALEKEKITETIADYHFLFMPSQGENYGHSMVESLIHGKPIIISNRTPWKNLQGRHSLTVGPNSSNHPSSVGWDLPLESPECFVEVIKYCVNMGQEEYDAMSLRAFNYAKRITEDPAVIEANRRLFEA